MLDKHVLPNLIALGIIALAWFLPAPWQAIALSTGLFALSGAVTNWLAVHMLFNRVPGLYGSGVVPLHFTEFKTAIMRLVHEQLLTEERVDHFFRQTPNDAAQTPTENLGRQTAAIDLAPLVEKLDLDAAYDQLVSTIMESSFGSMLGMVGGESALQPLREPFKRRMSSFMTSAVQSPRMQTAIQQQLQHMGSSEAFRDRLDAILRARLDEMTPEMVRDIVQQMIKKHLGWLVIWGGVFGGLIGLLAGIVSHLTSGSI